MEYCFDLGVWNSVFAVPADIVDKHIKLAGAAQLKVVLWMLRHAGENFGINDISKALSMHEADVRDSMQYWVQTGVVSFRDNIITPAPAVNGAGDGLADLTAEQQQAEAHEEAEQTDIVTQAGQSERDEKTEPEENHKRALSRPEKPDMKYLNQRMTDDPAIACLMHSADDIFGRMISNNDKQTLLLIHEYDGLPVEVILMLLQYAASIGKMNMRYIEKIAIKWADDEIFTLEAAEARIAQLTESATAARRVQRIIGLEPHSPTELEKELAGRWVDQWCFSDELIRAAYESCVNAKGKYFPKYTDSILRRWHNSGIKNIEQLEKMKTDDINIKNKKKAEKSYKPTYDISAYEQTGMLGEEWDD